MEQVRYLIGLTTLVVVGVAAWFIFDLITDDKLADRFRLTLVFEDVRGLRAGGDVRYRGVQVGQVLDVRVTNDGEKAEVEIVLDEGAEELACVRSRFWIVSPRFDGLTAGATGLDTLVRDSYIAFLTPTPNGGPLAPSGNVAGLERPFVDPDAVGLDPVRHGDLEMFLHTPANHGLKIGSVVRFRGIQTGDVRSIELAEDGSHVILGLRIAQAFRSTVTDSSRFWVARPRVSGAITGFSVQDLNALLIPFVGYTTKHGVGLAVPDGYHVVSRDERPTQDVAPIKVPDPPEDRPGDPTDESGVCTVKVSFEAVEEDWLSANDRVNRDSTGVLFIDTTGRAVVVTCRSACDAAYFMSDTFGMDPDIKDESIRVTLANGAVLRAGRSWVAANGLDLALIVLEDAPPDLDVTDAEQFDFDPAAADGGSLTQRDFEGSVEPLTKSALPSVDAARGRLLLREGRVVGLLGQVAGQNTNPRVIPIAELPAELRPPAR